MYLFIFHKLVNLALVITVLTFSGLVGINSLLLPCGIKYHEYNIFYFL